jgi:hypothetical protein
LAPENAKVVWTPEEDLILLEKQKIFGNQWSKIRDFLPRRSIVSIKNRWNWLCRRNVPNHSEEFVATAKTHTGKNEGNNTEGSRIEGSNIEGNNTDQPVVVPE